MNVDGRPPRYDTLIHPSDDQTHRCRPMEFNYYSRENRQNDRRENLYTSNELLRQFESNRFYNYRKSLYRGNEMLPPHHQRLDAIARDPLENLT